MRRTLTVPSLLALLICSAAPLLAQSAPRGFIGLDIGPSAPFGTLMRAGTVDATAGPAAPGYTDTFLNVSYRLRERFGIAGLLAYSEFVTPSVGNDDWWQVATAMVGPMYSLPLGTRTAVDFKAMAGFVALTPVVASYTTEHQTSAGGGVDLRATVRYHVLTHWAIFAEGGVQAATAKFPSGLSGNMGSAMAGFGDRVPAVLVAAPRSSYRGMKKNPITRRRFATRPRRYLCSCR